MDKQITCRVPERLIKKMDMVIEEEKKYTWKEPCKQSSIIRASIEKFVTDYEKELVNHTHFSGILIKYLDVNELKSLLKKAALTAFNANDTEATNEYINALNELESAVTGVKEGEK